MVTLTRLLVCLFVLCTVLLAKATPIHCRPVCDTYMTTFLVVNRRHLCQGRRSAPPYSPFPAPPPSYEDGTLSVVQVRGVCNHIRETHALRERAKIQKLAVLYIRAEKLLAVEALQQSDDLAWDADKLANLRQFVRRWTNPRMCIFTSNGIP